MKERWDKIEDFPIYSISDFGRVRNELRGTLLKNCYVQYGMLVVSLYRDGKQHRRSVATLVAGSFIPSPPREDFTTIIHKDGNRDNCHYTNLDWRPRHFAIRFHRERMLSPFPNWRLPFRMLDTGEIFSTPSECAVKYGLLEGGIYLALVNQSPVFPGNYMFEFLKGDNIPRTERRI